MSYDYVRVIAMLFIVLCHFFQILGNVNVALWLNVGVQIFLVLSAKLLCNRKFNCVKDVLLFYKKRILRLMIPVWIYLILAVLILLLIKQPVSGLAVLIYALGGAAFTQSGLLGLGHFWYITIILIAYLLIPVLSILAGKLKNVNHCLFVVSIVLIAINVLVLRFIVGLFNRIIGGEKK